MKTKTINIYTIKELKEVNKKAFEKVLDDIREKVIDDRLLYLFEETAKEIASNEYGFDDIDLAYSFNYSQGDGVSFTCDIDINKLNKFIEFTREEKLLIDLYELDFRLKRVHSNYCYDETCDIDYTSNSYDFDDAEEKIIENLQEKIYKHFIKCCNELKKIGYQCYDVDYDEVIRFIDENDYYFTKNGIIERCK